MLQGGVLAVSLGSSFWVDIWLFFLAVDKTFNLVIFSPNIHENVSISKT